MVVHRCNTTAKTKRKTNSRGTKLSVPEQCIQQKQKLKCCEQFSFLVVHYTVLNVELFIISAKSMSINKKFFNFQLIILWLLFPFYVLDETNTPIGYK